ncbi:MAG: hypothetical protein ACPG7F_03345 [Aggregatilineales bacterium]
MSSPNDSGMLFAPTAPRKRLQLRLSERRLLLMAGDAVVLVLSVLVSLFIWSQVADKSFNLDFIIPQLSWFFVLPGMWIILASANDYYVLPIAANRVDSLQRLILITMQMLVVYLLVFFLSESGSLPRLFIGYYGVCGAL